MNDGVDAQREAFEKVYGVGGGQFAFHDSSDPLMRYVRDRRLNVGLRRLARSCPAGWRGWSALVVCGGVGGEGTFLLKAGFAPVTVSDVSPAAIESCARRDRKLVGRVMDAECLDAPDDSYDLVLVQDGLHHLSRPVTGLTEMLRVARRAVIVIEPYDGLVKKLLSEEWEQTEGATTYVFRWRRRFFQEAVYSYLSAPPADLEVIRLWDQNVYVRGFAARLGRNQHGRAVAQATYALLRPFDRLGNAMVGVVVL